MRGEKKLELLKQHLKTIARKLKHGSRLVFQIYNDPQHPAGVVLERLKDNKVNVLVWSDLDPRKMIHANKVAFYRTQLCQFCQEEWAMIPANCSDKLMEGKPECLTQVVQFKGSTTKY